MRTPKSKLVRKILNERKGKKLNEKLIKLNEAIDRPFETKEEIENWLKEMRIENYVINDDLTVDVDGDVDLENMGLAIIPVKFGVVKGYFSCIYNGLTSLEGAPKEVGGDFKCNNCGLTSLKWIPEKIGGDLVIYYNNLLSLEGIKEVGGSIYASNNNLKSMEGLPETINGDLDVSFNSDLSLKGISKTIKGDLDITYCDINIIKEFSALNYDVTVEGTAKILSGNDGLDIPHLNTFDVE